MGEKADNWRYRFPRLRDLLLAAETSERLKLDRAGRIRIESAVDYIDKTRAVIEAFLQDPGSSTEAVAWLKLFGVMQAAYVQQDAILELTDTLGISYEPPSAWGRIRETRNDAFGHPVNRHKGPLRSSYMTRMVSSARAPKVNVTRRFADGSLTTETRHDMLDLIEAQDRILNEVAELLLRRLEPS